jgi:hypothetical protein
MKKQYFSIVILLIIVAGTILSVNFVLSPDSSGETSLKQKEQQVQKIWTAELLEPVPGVTISFPLTVRGIAPADWFLGDQILIRILNEDLEAVHTMSAKGGEVSANGGREFSALIESFPYTPGESGTFMVIETTADTIVGDESEVFAINFPAE